MFLVKWPPSGSLKFWLSKICDSEFRKINGFLYNSVTESHSKGNITLWAMMDLLKFVGTTLLWATLISTVFWQLSNPLDYLLSFYLILELFLPSRGATSINYKILLGLSNKCLSLLLGLICWSVIMILLIYHLLTFPS